MSLLPTSPEDLSLIIGLFGLKKVIGPTLDMAGLRLRDIVRPLIERAIERITNKSNSDRFQNNHLTNNRLLYLPVDDPNLMNPYLHCKEWHWLLDSFKKDEMLNVLMPERHDVKVDRYRFINLLYQSLSLNKAEKWRVLNS